MSRATENTDIQYVSEFPTVRNQMIRATTRRYRGNNYVDLRVWAERRDGTVVPTPAGISLHADQIDRLINAAIALAVAVRDDQEVQRDA